MGRKSKLFKGTVLKCRYFSALDVDSSPIYGLRSLRAARYEPQSCRIQLIEI